MSEKFDKKSKVFSGGVYKTQKALRGKLNQLRYKKYEGHTMKKPEWEDLFTDMVKKRKGKLTFRQMERDLYLEHGIKQKERKQIMEWAKKNFAKSDASIKSDQSSTKKGFFERLIDKTKDKEVKKMIMTPKKELYAKGITNADNQNSLGIKNVNQGFKAGRGIGSKTNNSLNKNKSKPGGLTQSGNQSLTRNAPRELGDNKANYNNRPRIGGL